VGETGVVAALRPPRSHPRPGRSRSSCRGCGLPLVVVAPLHRTVGLRSLTATGPGGRTVSRPPPMTHQPS
jgi:hypothetical protein